MPNSVSNKAKVRKQEPLFWCRNCQPKPVIEKPWIATLPYVGTTNFATWREAMDFAARYRMPMPNNTATVHRFGLELGPEAFDRLGQELDRITAAEQQAWQCLTR